MDLGNNMDQLYPIDLDEEEDGMDCRASSGFTSASTAGSLTASSKRRKKKVNVLERLVDLFEKLNNTITSKLEEEKEREIIQMQCDLCMDAIRKLPNVTTKMIAGAMDIFVDPATRAMFLRATPDEQFAYLEYKFS